MQVASALHHYQVCYLGTGPAIKQASRSSKGQKKSDATRHTQDMLQAVLHALDHDTLLVVQSDDLRDSHLADDVAQLMSQGWYNGLTTRKEDQEQVYGALRQKDTEDVTPEGLGKHGAELIRKRLRVAVLGESG